MKWLLLLWLFPVAGCAGNTEAEPVLQDSAKVDGTHVDDSLLAPADTLPPTTSQPPGR